MKRRDGGLTKSFHLSLRILNIIILVSTLVIFQFKIDHTNIYTIFTLVIPSILVTYSEVNQKQYPKITALSFVFILIAYMYFPINVIDIISYNYWPFILIGSLFFFLRPRTEYMAAYLYLYMGCYLYLFFSTGWEANGNPILLFRDFYFSEEWFIFYSQYKLLMLIGAFGLHLLIAIIRKEYIPNNIFNFIASVITWPIAFIGIAIVGYLYGVYLTVYTYINIFRKNVKPYKGMRNDAEQPAIEKYIFWKAFKDANIVMKTAFHENKENWKRVKTNLFRHKRVYGSVITVFIKVSSYASILTLVLVGQSLLIIISLVYFATISLYSLPVILFWKICYYTDKFFRKWNHVKTVCPSCYESSELPVYHCSNCHSKHTDLVPGKYGILKRTCQCGQRLPATYFNGRKDLHASCPSCCNRDMSHESTPITIPIIGGSNSGKTSFLLAAVGQLAEYSKSLGVKVRYPNKSLESKVDSYYSNLSAGIRPEKTNNRQKSAECVGLKHPKWHTEKMIYLYDPAGETFENSSDFKKQKYLSYYDASILILDPFSSPSIREKMNLTKTWNSVDFEDIFDLFLLELQESYGVKAHEKIKKPIAILINKMDQKLNFQIGEETMKQISVASDTESVEEITHQQCIDLLSSMGLNNFLRKVDSKFSNYRFFASSSISDQNNSSGKLLTWLLTEKNKSWKKIEKSL